MENMQQFIEKVPAQAYYVVIAVAGGAARYLNTYSEGGFKFSVAIFIASAFAAGFSGMMFALFGDAMSLPNPLPHIMAGVGGFFGDQSMKFLLEYFTKEKLKQNV